MVARPTVERWCNTTVFVADGCVQYTHDSVLDGIVKKWDKKIIAGPQGPRLVGGIPEFRIFHPTRLWGAAPLFVFTLLLGIVLLVQHAHASLEKLSRFQRKCFRDIGRCVMFMDGERAFGCAQCGQDTRTAILREVTSSEVLLRLVSPANDRFIFLVPEFVFLDPGVVRNLETATNVAAVVVYEQSLDANNETLNFPPIIGNRLSSDAAEPNMAYNIYPEGETPSQGGSTVPPSTTIERNPFGRGSKFLLFPFNIFHVNSTIAGFLRERIERFPIQDGFFSVQEDNPRRSSTAPRYKGQSRGQMFACPPEAAETSNVSGSTNPEDDSASGQQSWEDKTNSKKCLSEKTCLPIGGQSLWSALGRVDFSREGGPREVLAITAPMDSLAFFPDLSLGASAEIASVAVLMAVAKSVAEYRRGEGKNIKMKLQPVYFLWNAESWGYTGSSRFLKDVQEFECKIENNASEGKKGCSDRFMDSLKFKDFKDKPFTVLNIGQITTPIFENATVQNANFYKQGIRIRDIDQEEDPGEGPLEKALSKAFENNELQLTLAEGSRDITPIDSSQSFQKYLPEAEVVSITSYNESFTNSLYHSIYDDKRLIKHTEPIRVLAKLIARTVISLAFEKEDVPVEIDNEVIDQVLFCLTSRTQWRDCKMAKEFLGEMLDKVKDDVKPGNYPGSFFPSTRLFDSNTGAFAKLILVRNFMAFHNQYELDQELDQERNCSEEKENSCDAFFEGVNKDAGAQSHSELRTGVCTRGTCVASDTYTHNAFGTALDSTNTAQSEFEYKEEGNGEEEESNSVTASTPKEAGFTESVWDFEHGFCGFVEDTTTFGVVILALGIFIMLLSMVFVFCFDKRLEKSEGDPPGAISIAAVFL
ncbi:unnamed protein product [Chondrus crispus]|uniref:Nicastrin n=1 Tax=Chondrus crispus TaxID=2769 RepID=R7QN81_CHOCR|nr:unnamed protein product [Chondrus crispus]CDF39539.1 unnamed protein product [Chondrus crispus]|eukprot:XP_005709833.1 unnamed protein product [Chondrus crispus]